MGGKTATSTQQVQVPPQVLAQYQSVNQAAETTAQTPFQQYSGEFVAPVNAEQTAGIAGTNAAANEAQPYFGAATGTLGGAQAGVNPINQTATGLAAASAQAVNPTALDANAIDQYMSPYLKDVVGSESAVLNQNNQQQQAGQLGNAIRSGAFGSDRTGIAAANLEQQQNIANANIYSGLLNTGYNTALSTAQQQQGVGLSAAQANRTALGNAATTLAGVGQTAYGEGANTASELASLGTGAQSAGLAGAQAQIGAGTVQQQTSQAQDTALYNQFLQQQSYPFQVDQFLANIAEGTGALSGSTTTTQQPGGFFSDERLKEDMEPIGKTFDGQPIYRYKMKGDSRDRIGLSAQKVEKRHPDAVGLAGGFRYVDYGKATEEAANRGHFYSGGVVPFRQTKAVGGDPYDDGQGGLGAVLSAQRSMYGSPGAGGQRNIPASGATHQLAVASGTPAPPPSGSSGVNQAIGLGQKGYQGYKYFTKPPDTSGLGATADQEAGAEAANINATMTPAPIEGLGGANSGAAGDAAASGAGEAAAGAGADAAATGAATGAATAVAGEGAADAAAALAAEYAAADVAAVAIMAAKRGGRIKGRKGYDTGGMPYTDDGMQINIPDEQTSPHLQSAGPLVKQPTGLQTAMKLGDPNQTSSLMGSMFSNTAAARGGLIDARRGYADGGLPDDFDEGDSAPAGDTSSAPATGLAASTPATSAAAPPAAEPKEHIFDKLKKPENLIPILSAIGAMGTAKTRSLGTALAAGVGAGADSYVTTQEGLAKAQNVQQEAKGRGIANEYAQTGLDAYRSALKGQGNVAMPTPVRPAGMVSSDPNDPQESAFTRFAPLPTARPDAVNQAVTGMTMGRQGEAAKTYGDQWDQKIAGANQQRQQSANATYLQAAEIASAPPGQAFAKLAKSNPQQAQQLQQKTGAQSPEQLDQSAREYASHLGLAAHQYSGRPIDMTNGVMIDRQTGQPVVGSTQIMTGLTPAEKAAKYSEAINPVTLENGLPGQTWKKNGFASPEAMVLAADKAARLSSATSNNAAPQVGVTAPAPGVAPTQSAAPPARAAAPPAPRTTPPAAPATPATNSTDPYLEKALADPEYKLAPLPKVVDQTTKEKALKTQEINLTQRLKLLQDSEQATSAAATSLQYMHAAKSIMDSKGATVGVYGGLLAKASQVMGGGPQSQNYQELAKYLGNAAIQMGKANFPNATQSEVGLQMTELSPNTKMDDATINNLLNTNIRSSQYTLDSANRAKDYVDRGGGDPNNFNKWNQKYYPRDRIINTPTEGAVPVKSKDEAMKLPSGTVFITPDGRRKVRP